MKYRAIDIIKAIGAEFADVPAWKIEMWIEICRPLVSRKQFGNRYELALAYMVCHKMKMAGEGISPLNDLGGIGAGFGLGSVSEGGSSISFSASPSGNIADDAEYGLTVYGTQYLQLRKLSVVPIHITNEVDFPYERYTGLLPPRRPPCEGEPPECQCEPEGEPSECPCEPAEPEPGPCGEECPCKPGPPDRIPPFPIANEEKFGGVKVKPGSGLTVDEEGYLSVDVDSILQETDGEEP